MSFLAPFFLIGLGALLVPIIIHMWSKDAKKSVDFGSLRFLRETETRTTRSIMPSQWLLLLTRLLFLTLLVFLIAEMHLPSKVEKVSRLYLVDPIYQNSELLSNLLDTVSQEAEVKWLANDFPSVTEPIKKSETTYWDLLSQAPSNAECLVVISPLFQKDFNGVLKEVSPVCQWIKPPMEPQESELISIVKNGEGKAATARYDEWGTIFEWANAENGEPLEIKYHLRIDESFKNLGGVFKAALSSIQRVSYVTLKEVNEIEEADWVIWLSDQPYSYERRVVLADEDVLSWQPISKDYILVSTTLTKTEAIQIELPRKLLDALVGDLIDVHSNDLLTVDTEVFKFKEQANTKAEVLVDASSYLWVLLLIVFLVERWLSYKSSAVEI
ncbi:BatA domain-containing protein [Ekhidna sp.]|uniref:BatA domain-containing protein n=1 Tax=Ekhidna sp. TaxID=2608089 RepID=UPI003514F12C